MGYRSEVAIKCQKNAYEKFAKVYKGCEPDKVLSNGDDDYLLYWSWIKWYDDYPEIQAINDVMTELDEMFGGDNENIYDNHWGYKFLRIGEDDNDVEDQSNCCDIELWMRREIDLSDFEK